LNIIKRLCVPDHDTAEGDVSPDDIPQNWPEHLDEAIRMMNDRILVALKSTPREVLFGRSITPENHSSNPTGLTTPSDADIRFALADSLRWTAHL
jgi:hypothetical protein